MGLGLDPGRISIGTPGDEADIVAAAVRESKEALGDMTTDPDQEHKPLPLTQSAFDGLCSHLSQAESSISRLSSPLPVVKVCPSPDNNLMGMVKPKKIPSA